MKNRPLVKGTIIRTVFVSLEVIALTAISVYFSFAAVDGIWGYWGSLVAIFGLLGPIFIYVIASAIFNTLNMKMVLGNRHTPETIKKYHKLSKKYFIWGIVTCGIYGLPPIFLLENIFLFKEYGKELEKINNT